MPFRYKKKLSKRGGIAVWKIEKHWLNHLPQLDLNPQELQYFESLKPHRQREWLSVRYAISQVIERPARIVKDEYGKPSLADDDRILSISHSEDMVAFILHEKSVGVDIQIQKQKIKRIYQKFLKSEEIPPSYEGDFIESLHYTWGAKECLFKAYGKNEVDFRQHLNVGSFVYDPEETISFDGSVTKGETNQTYTCYAISLSDYHLVYCIEI